MSEKPAKANCTNCNRLQLSDQLGEDGRCVYCTVFSRDAKPAAATTPARRKR